jgi:hypothetical protein
MSTQTHTETRQSESSPTDTETRQTDRWAAKISETPTKDSATERINPLAAPLTFDPFSTRRLRSCTDEENAAMPRPSGRAD